MNRKSLALSAGIAHAVQNLVKEISRLRTEHAFGEVEIDLVSRPGHGTEVSIDMRSSANFAFTTDGEFADNVDQWVQKDLTGVGDEIAAQEP